MCIEVVRLNTGWSALSTKSKASAPAVKDTISTTTHFTEWVNWTMFSNCQCCQQWTLNLMMQGFAYNIEQH